MNQKSLIKPVLIIALVPVLFACEQNNRGPLRVSKINPRYFTDNSGKAIYLTGSHTWNNFVDMIPEEESTVFYYDEYIKFLTAHNHNFIRLWAWDIHTWDTKRNQSRDSLLLQVNLKPWLRTGSGVALDGKPKYDLTKFNPDYFSRLKERVQAAGEANIYVSVMLFEGWGTQFLTGAFNDHPFHPENNINGIDMDTSHDSLGVKIYELGNDKITELQELYVNKVIETVGGFDNVLYEISNENHPESTEWQYHMINYVKKVENESGKVHPVGMTFQHKGGQNQTLFDSPADWISQGREGNYQNNPPASNGQKVILTDTDHMWGIGGYRQWVWKSFLRGMNPIFMDPYKGRVLNKGKGDRWEQEMRVSMGLSRKIAYKIDLINMVPSTTIATSGYCLAAEGKEYLVYIPEGKETNVDLTSSKGSFEVTWIDPLSGNTWAGDPIPGGNANKLVSPFETADALVHVKIK